jgi:hypothetical protein
MEYAQTPGRFIKLLISDGNENNPRYLGVVSISSDVITITDRDKYIGWTPEDKLENKMLKHSEYIPNKLEAKMNVLDIMSF